MRVGILGLGLIGGSLLRRLAAEEGLEVSGWDADPDTREASAVAGYAVAGSETALSAWAGLVVVAVPPRATASAVLRALAANERVVVCDVASVKEPVVAAVRAEADPAALHRFVPAHPLAGAEAGGWEASRADLLDDAVWAICPPAPDAPLGALGIVASMLDRLGARLAFCTAAEHDAAVARSSHAPHVVAQVLALTADTPLAAVLSGGALRDGTRVAGANPALWMDVLALNRGAVLEALRQVERRLAELAAVIEAGDPGPMEAVWRAAGASRTAAEQARWTQLTWRDLASAHPTWAELLELGHQGGIVRRLRVNGSRLSCQVAHGFAA